MKNCSYRAKAKQAGYTLVEIAIVLLIVGFFIAGYAKLYPLYNVEQKVNETELARTRITLALDDFKQRYGRYPCPARYDLPRDHVDYGKEGNCTDTSVMPGSCSNGYCVEESIATRTVQLDDGTTITPRVRRGAVPFRTLFLAEENSYDAFGARFSYAVTEILTDWEEFAVSRGGIEVVDNVFPTPNSVVSPPGSALYFVFSHGPDNIGAYNIKGEQIAPCNGFMADNENCNTSNAEKTAVYRSSTKNDELIDTIDAAAPMPTGPPTAVDANMHYDDYASFFAGEEAPLWRYSESAGNDGDVHDLLNPVDKVTFGVTTETQKVNIGGNLKATPTDPSLDGKILMNNVCGRDANTDCFSPELVAGTGMHCTDTATQIAVGVGGRNVQCIDEDDVVINCEGTGGTVITGFDPVTGEVQCGNLPQSCAVTTKTLCSQLRSLPPIGDPAPAVHNTSVTLTAGASFTQVWRCSDGAWVKDSETGVCNCTPGSVVTHPGCGAGYSGTVTRTVTTTCPAGTTTTTEDRSACVCTGQSQTATQTCPAPFNPTTQTRTRTRACVGNILQPWGAYGPWAPPCTCSALPPQTESVACPPNLTGSASRTRTLNTTNCTWNPWTYDYSGCSCDPSRTQPATQACPSGETGIINGTRTLQCPSATWGPFVETGRTCACTNRYIYRPGPSCPAGQTGSITERKYVDCHGNDVTGYDWEQDTNSCQIPPICKWASIPATTQGGTFPSPGGPEPNDVCACGSANRTCGTPLGPSIYQRMQCKCE